MLKKYNNLSLFSKISFVMCGLALVLSTVITLTAVIYYRYIFSERLLGGISHDQRRKHARYELYGHHRTFCAHLRHREI